MCLFLRSHGGETDSSVDSFINLLAMVMMTPMMEVLRLRRDMNRSALVAECSTVGNLFNNWLAMTEMARPVTVGAR